MEKLAISSWVRSSNTSAISVGLGCIILGHGAFGQVLGHKIGHDAAGARRINPHFLGHKADGRVFGGGTAKTGCDPRHRREPMKNGWVQRVFHRPHQQIAQLAAHHKAHPLKVGHIKGDKVVSRLRQPLGKAGMRAVDWQGLHAEVWRSLSYF